MLRIKKDIPLEKLKEYGFKEKHWGYIYYPKDNGGDCKYHSSIRIDYLDSNIFVVNVEM